MKNPTLSDLKLQAKQSGLTIRKQDGEYIIRNPRTAAKYFTDCPQDASMTMLAMGTPDIAPKISETKTEKPMIYALIDRINTVEWFEGTPKQLNELLDILGGTVLIESENKELVASCERALQEK